jgi:hypothetical protein
MRIMASTLAAIVVWTALATLAALPVLIVAERLMTPRRLRPSLLTFWAEAIAGLGAILWAAILLCGFAGLAILLLSMVLHLL